MTNNFTKLCELAVAGLKAKPEEESSSLVFMVDDGSAFKELYLAPEIVYSYVRGNHEHELNQWHPYITVTLRDEKLTTHDNQPAVVRELAIKFLEHYIETALPL